MRLQSNWDVRAAVGGELLFRAIATLRLTARFEGSGIEAVDACRRRGRPLVFVGWHGDDLAHLCMYHVLFGRQARGALLVPDDSDGRLMTWLAQRLGLAVSSLGADTSPVGAARGVIHMIGLVRDGWDALLAVDGPRGPVHEVKPGAALIAQRAGAVVVPMASAVSRGITLHRRWDRHMVPLPAARVVVHFGPLIDTVRSSAARPSIEDLQGQIRCALLAGAAQARLQLNEGIGEPVLPEPVPKSLG